MNNFKRSSQGSALILCVTAISLSSLILTGFSFRGTLEQRNSNRRVSQNNLHHLLMEQVITRVMTDLKVAIKYPSAVFLINPPVRTRFADRTSPCESRIVPGRVPAPACADMVEERRFHLDTYLLPACGPNYPCGGYGPGLRKVLVYPRAGFNVPYFGPNARAAAGAALVPTNDPIVTVTQLGGGRHSYRLQITLTVCPTPPAGGGACPEPIATLAYDGILDTSTNYFQQP